MLKCSAQSIIGQRTTLNYANEAWYDDVIELVLENLDTIEEEDIVIAVQTAMHVVDFRSQECQEDSVGNQKETDEKSAGRKKWVSRTVTPENEVSVRSLLRENTKEQEENKGQNAVTNGIRGAGQEGQGLFGTDSATHGWALDKFLNASGTSKHAKKIMALIAWSLAFLGLIVSLVFLTRDFISSRNETASTVKYEMSDTLDLPKLWFCTAETALPAFNEMPSQYRGEPLFWVDFVKGTNAHLNVTFPDTRGLSQFGMVTIGAKGQPCNASKAMDPILFYEENGTKPPCFHCLSMIRNPALRIDRNRPGQSALKHFSSHAAIRLSHQSFISRCRTVQHGINKPLYRFFREQMKEHSSNLEQRGILNFGQYDAKNISHEHLLWPTFRAGFNNASEDFKMADVLDMFCNVYLFSGYFYPSTAPDVRFSFNGPSLRWTRSGKGPYYPASFSEYHTKTKGILLNPSMVIGKEKYESVSSLSGANLYIMTNASRVGNAETMAVLSPAEIASISFSRNDINGKEVFQTEVLRSFLEYRDKRAASYVYFVDFRFKSFFTRLITKQQAMSWTAFLADFFGLTSLFLDISVYTLIVAPISGRTSHIFSRKRKQLEAMKQT